jgi:hypothetical protein
MEQYPALLDYLRLLPFMAMTQEASMRLNHNVVGGYWFRDDVPCFHIDTINLTIIKWNA